MVHRHRKREFISGSCVLREYRSKSVIGEVENMGSAYKVSA